MPRNSKAQDDLIADPFLERASGLGSERLHVIGGLFRFESDSSRLLKIVRHAYAGLPRHRLESVTPRFRLRLVVRPAERSRVTAPPPPIQMMSGAGLLYAATEPSSCVVISPDERAALVVVSQEMLKFPYHTRYELIELAVCTLAARAQSLVPMHAACVGSHGRGVLLIGPSGAGKSTLALHALLGGLDFLAEDSVFVTPDTLLATGVANFLHVRADSLRFLSRRADVLAIRRAPVIRRRSGVEKFELDLRSGRYRLAPAPLQIAAAVLLSAKSAGEGSLVRPISKSRLIAELRASQPYAVHQPGWKSFSRRVSSLPAFELRRGRHPAESVEALRDLLQPAAGSK
jgi:energy-coupling factor transporter ATP-binding protein EcfA2